MKRALFIILFIFLFGFMAAMADGDGGSQENVRQYTFQGVVIFVSDSTIEIKRGNRELIFSMSDSTNVMRDDSQAGRSNLQVCQLVRVTYTNGENRTATRIDIVRESRCTR